MANNTMFLAEKRFCSTLV